MKKDDVKVILQEAYEKGREAALSGKVASYIPELAKANKNALGVSLCFKDGEHIHVGDTTTRFSIQSISKVILFIQALEHLGPEKVFAKVGMEPSGEAFNSLVELDLITNKPFNPMINSGALAVSGLLRAQFTFEELRDYARRVCADPFIDVDEAVFKSEMGHNARNRAIAYLLESKGILESHVEETVEFYTKMCSLRVNAENLSDFAMLLANGGADIRSGERIFSLKTAMLVKTIMLTCGMYDGSGEFAVRVGIPTKSGVGGGLLSVADGRMGIGIYGPSLDEKGNCIAGKKILQELSERLELHIFSEHESHDSGLR